MSLSNLRNVDIIKTMDWILYGAILFIGWWFFKDIFKFYWDYFGEDYTHYPLFSKRDIATHEQGLERRFKELMKTQSRIYKIEENEKKKGKVTLNKGYSDNIKYEMEHYIFEEVFYSYSKRELNLKKESNIAILNGKRIKDIEDQYDKRGIVSGSKVNKIGYLYKLWENDKVDSSKWVDALNEMLNNDFK